MELLFHIDDSVSYAATTARVPVLIIEGKKDVLRVTGEGRGTARGDTLTKEPLLDAGETVQPI